MRWRHLNCLTNLSLLQHPDERGPSPPWVLKRRQPILLPPGVFPPSCHLGDERMNKARPPTSSANAGSAPHHTRRQGGVNQGSEATTSFSALPGTRLATGHFLWTVRRWPAQTLSLNIYIYNIYNNLLSQYQQWMEEVIMDKLQWI